MGWTVYNSDGQILQGSSTLADDAVTTAKILDDAVTYVKLQNLATADRVLGSESTGVIGEVQIVPDMIASNAVTTAKILDANVTLAKIASQAANTVLVRDASSSGVVSAKAVTDTQILIGDGTGFTAAALSGDVTMANSGATTIATDAVDIAMLSATGTASSSTFLRGDNAWAAAGGGKLELINTAVADNDNDLVIDGVVGYDTYLITVSGIHPSTDNANIRMRFGDSSSIHEANGDYAWHQTALEPSSTGYSATASTSAHYISLNNSGTGTDAGESFGGAWWLFAPDDDSMMPMVCGQQVGVRSATSAIGGGMVIGNRKAVMTLTKVQIVPHAGTLMSGRMTVYGVAHD